MIPPLAQTVLQIAREAGDAILAVYRGAELTVTHKADASPVTQADWAAHHHIVAALQRAAPDLPILSEEDAAIAPAVRRAWTRYWLVDPLDGTQEFIKRNDDFTVNIALIENGKPVLGVVHAPALSLTYVAARQHGAWHVTGDDAKPIRTRRVPAVPRLLISRSHRDADLEALLAQLPPHESINRGSSLKLCFVAAGEADLYPRTGPTSEWDTAAGHAILLEAGGTLLQLPELTPLSYNQKDSVLNPGFIAYGDEMFGWAQRLQT